MVKYALFLYYNTCKEEITKHKRKEVNKMTITFANVKETYIEQIETLDNTADVLTTEEKEELKRDFVKVENETDLYMVALDWNVTIAVVKMVVKRF